MALIFKMLSLLLSHYYNIDTLSLSSQEQQQQPNNKLSFSFPLQTFEDASENLSTKSTLSDSGHSSTSRMSPDASSTHSTHSATESGVEDTNFSEEELTPVQPSLEDSLRDITRLLAMALDNHFHEAYRGTEKW